MEDILKALSTELGGGQDATQVSSMILQGKMHPRSMRASKPRGRRHRPLPREDSRHTQTWRWIQRDVEGSAQPAPGRGSVQH